MTKRVKSAQGLMFVEVLLVVGRRATAVYVTKKIDVPVRKGQTTSSVWMGIGK